MGRAAKIVVAKSALKRHRPTKKLARELAAKQHPVSKSAVQCYLRHCLQLKPLKLHSQPRMTAAQQQKLLDFAPARRSWSIQKWRQLLFSD